MDIKNKIESDIEYILTQLNSYLTVSQFTKILVLWELGEGSNYLNYLQNCSSADLNRIEYEVIKLSKNRIEPYLENLDVHSLSIIEELNRIFSTKY